MSKEDTPKKLEGSKRPPYVPPEAIPDTLVVPPNTIYLVPDQMEFQFPKDLDSLLKH